MDKAELYAKAFIKSVEKEPSRLIPEKISNLFKILQVRKETYLLPKIKQVLIRRFSFNHNMIVLSAHGLSKSSKEKIADFLAKRFSDFKKSNTEYRNDPTLIAGIRVSYKDFLFDGTLIDAVRKFKQNY